MAVRVRMHDILDVAEACGLQDYPFWADAERRVTDADITEALVEGRLMEPDDGRHPDTPMPAADHAARIAWLVANLDLTQVTVTVRDGRLVDGNHRFAACLYAGIEAVRCVLMDGDLSPAAVAEAA